MTINKFILGTKQFFNKKPVRIVVALLVIVAIMTGVAFGIMALIGAFSDPCTKQTGTTWDKDLKVCVKDSCQMDNGEDGIVCKAKGKVNQCIATDYCDYSGPEGQYSYDEESCMCKLDCSEGEGYTKSGKNSTLMREDNNKPEDSLTCGYYCEYASNIEGNDFGGNNWCMNGYICGLNKLDTTPQTYGQFPGMCLDPSYELCPGSESVACKNGQCVSTPEGQLCQFIKCGDGLSADDKIKRIACEKREDCYADGIIGSDSQYECLPLSERKFQTVGICVDKKNNSGTNKSNGDPTCLNPTYIGENKDGKAVDCRKASPTNTPLQGITRRVKQCSDSLKLGKSIYDKTGTDYNTCALHGVCSSGNEWEAYPDDNKSQFNCTSSSPEICSLSEQCEADESDCCPGRKVNNPTDSSKSFCCAVSTTGNPNCFNQTLYPYSLSRLQNINEDSFVTNDPITQPKDTDISTLNNKLKTYNNLLQSQLEGKSSIVLTDPNYAGVYWEQQTDDSFHLKANCGAYNRLDDQENAFDVINIDSADGKNGVSFCVPKSTCTVTLPKYLPPPGGKTADFNGIPICYKPATKDGPYYWTADPTKSNQTDFITTASASFTNCNTKDKGCVQNCTKESSFNTCASIGKHIQGFNNVRYDSSNKECIFNIACANTSHDLGLKKNVPWTEIGSKLISSGLEIINTSAGEIFKNSISQTPLGQRTQYVSGYKYVNGQCQGSLNKYPLEVTKSPYETTLPNTQCRELVSDFNINLLTSGVYCQYGVYKNQYPATQCKKK